MATPNYSNYYVLNPDQRTYSAFSPNNVRPGEIIVIRGAVSFPAGTVATDYGVYAPVVAGLRPVFGQVDATATNGSLTGTLGWTSDVDAIASLTTQIQSATSTALTAAQIKAVANLSEDGDEILLTLAGTFSNATIITVTLGLVNCGA